MLLNVVDLFVFSEVIIRFQMEDVAYLTSFAHEKYEDVFILALKSLI